MKAKIRLINICIRHKCTGINNDINNIKESSKKSVHLQKNEDLQYAIGIPTSKNNVGKQSENNIQKVSVDANNGSAISDCTSSALLSNERNHTILNRKVNSVQSDWYNCPRLPNNFVQDIPLDVYNHYHNVLFEDCNCPEKLKSNDKHMPLNDSVDTRINEINMQMLSKPLYEQIFKNSSEQESIPLRELQSIKDNLKSFGINIENATRLPDVNIKLPPLEGENIEQHFYNIAKQQTAPYLKIINELIKDIPVMPKQWLLKEGWTRYTAEGAENVDYPLEDGIIFDVEVCMKEGPLPTIATAVTNKAWYGWVSKSVVTGLSKHFEGQSFTLDMLVPIESTVSENGQKLSVAQKKPKLIVGHNVSYDRSRIKEQYWLNCTGTRFLDTMSLHISNSGINSYQRSVLKSKNEDEEKTDLTTCTSLNNLADIHNFYCGFKLNKESRSVFVQGTLADIRNDFNTLMTYCATDVVATHNVLAKSFPIFQERFPHPVTLAGMLELGTAYLPVNSNWQRYLEESESTFEDLNYESKFTLAKRADSLCKLIHDEKYKEDLWMWDEDWSTQEIKVKISRAKKESNVKRNTQETQMEQSSPQKFLTDDEDEEDPLEKEFAYLKETKKRLPNKLPHMPGYPAWYRKLCPKVDDENWAPGPQNISTSMRIAPKLLNLMWENYPLHYVRDKGWGILVPYNNDPDIETKIPMKQLLQLCPLPNEECTQTALEYAMRSLEVNVQDNLHKTEFWRYKKKKSPDISHFYKGTGIWCNMDIDNCCHFFKLPHKNGANYNVGNPLARDFLNKFSENVLVGSDASAKEVLKISRMVSYWRNNRKRIMSQLVMWIENQYLPSNIKNTKQQIRYGAIVPGVIVCGTVTRRAVEPTWMTASNADKERVGSELRAMIQAPAGYNIVGADVDSQELWIASIIGDAYYKKIHGATPFGWMTLIGTKANGTDMHSVTAKAVDISRDHAKVINYARIYGAGEKFAQTLLKQFNPSMSTSEAASKSRKMFSLTKGKKIYTLKPEHANKNQRKKEFTAVEAYRLAKIHSTTVSELFGTNKWKDGSESAMFNRLEEIALSPNPATPFLNSRLTRALECEKNNEKYLPTKVNWVVQSGAVDFLHLMLVSMRWLMKDNARFCLSFHDEVRYLVPSRYKYNAALAMHVTNLLTRSFCASRLGMKDLPMSVAFFSSVEVDTALRKDASHDCNTPSNPHGLENGYGVPLGESLDVWAALEKSGGSLGSWNNAKTRSSTTANRSPQDSVTTKTSL